MFVKRQLAFGFQTTALHLAEKGLMEGVVGISPYKPDDIMEMAQLGAFKYDRVTGHVISNWEDKGSLSTFQRYLNKMAQLEMDRKSFKEANKTFDTIHDILRGLIKIKPGDALSTRIYPQDFNAMDFKALDTFTVPLGLQYKDFKNVEGCMSWEHPTEDLVELYFCPC